MSKAQDNLMEFIDKQAKLSHKLVAINAGMTESKLSRILAGSRRMTLDDYESICNAVAVDPGRFFEKKRSDSIETTN